MLRVPRGHISPRQAPARVCPVSPELQTAIPRPAPALRALRSSLYNHSADFLALSTEFNFELWFELRVVFTELDRQLCTDTLAFASACLRALKSFRHSSGTFTSNNGSITCTQCAAGSSQSANGQTTCDLCSTGQYSGTLGASSCLNCPSGQFMNHTNATQCFDCAAGSARLLPGASQCDLCSPGSVSSQLDSSHIGLVASRVKFGFALTSLNFQLQFTDISP